MNKQSKKIPINLPNLQDNFDIKLHLALGVLIVLDGLQQRLCQLSGDCPQKRSLSYGEGKLKNCSSHEHSCEKNIIT